MKRKDLQHIQIKSVEIAQSKIKANAANLGNGGAISVLSNIQTSVAGVLEAKGGLNGGNGGTIVNVSSAASRIGSPNEFIDYAAAKGAVDSMTIGLAKEVAAEGVRVNAVRPGLIYTDIHASAGEPGRVDRAKAGVPMQHGGTAAEVAEAIVWLASASSSYVTGTLLDVTGGR